MKVSFIERDIKDIRFTFAQDEIRIKCSKETLDLFKDKMETYAIKISNLLAKHIQHYTLRSIIFNDAFNKDHWVFYLRSCNKNICYKIFIENEAVLMQVTNKNKIGV